jgi:thiosulfate/3-mercaptopyruvate sulfurtransferase
MAYSLLVSTDELARHLHDDNWLIFDCRFDLAQPEWGFSDYQASHIPGAVYVHLNEDLSGPITPTSGRHPLPDPQVFAVKRAQWGIRTGKQVVVYDRTGGSYADRLWWMVKATGHNEVALLDGGFTKWETEKRAIAAGIELPHNPISQLSASSFDPRMWASVEEVDLVKENPEYCLIDARTPERFNAENEPIDPIAGHIPGAVNRFHGLNIKPDGTFKSVDQLRREFSQLLGSVKPENVIVYCGSGVTSIHHLVAMEIAGMNGARLFPGSWSEWIRDLNRSRVP